MNTLASDLYQYMATDTALRAYVGAKIYPQMAQENATLPYIVYSLITEERQQTLSLARISPYKTDWRFDCWGNSQAEADMLAQAVQERLQPASAPILNVRIGETVFHGIFFPFRIDQLVVPEDGTDAPIFGARVTATIWAEE